MEMKHMNHKHKIPTALLKIKGLTDYTGVCSECGQFFSLNMNIGKKSKWDKLKKTRWIP
jgi:hypothetical protein